MFSKDLLKFSSKVTFSAWAVFNGSSLYKKDNFNHAVLWKIYRSSYTFKSVFYTHTIPTEDTIARRQSYIIFIYYSDMMNYLSYYNLKNSLITRLLVIIIYIILDFISITNMIITEFIIFIIYIILITIDFTII
jgi:hypothetical protein